ncbi:sigma-54 interaction domain-containing protein [bacterium]
MSEKIKTESKKNPTLGFELIGESEPFKQVMESVKQVAPTNITVLITGESGTGKEIIARAIHKLSNRNEKSLFTVNCGAIPEGILESELFGHEKGSFTGASETRKGYFEVADGGTLFLDEIGEMPLATQVKLLRVLEEKEYMRVGGTETKQVNVRVLAATNKNLENAVQKGTFRKDLFYRLNAIKIEIPPLRRRKKDIRPLAIHFAQAVCDENNIKFGGLTEEALNFLEEYSWPGNARELRNIMERVIILGKGKRIDRALIQNHIVTEPETDRNLPVVLHKSTDQAERELIYRALIEIRMAVEEIRSMILGRIPNGKKKSEFNYPFEAAGESKEVESIEKENLNIINMEKSLIKEALDRFRRNRRKAAKALGIGERTLYRKLKEYNLEDY